jgi:hypothetical protein
MQRPLDRTQSRVFTSRARIVPAVVEPYSSVAGDRFLRIVKSGGDRGEPSLAKVQHDVRVVVGFAGDQGRSE